MPKRIALSLLAACSVPPAPPAPLAYPTHAMSVGADRTLVISDGARDASPGTVQTDGASVPLPKADPNGSVSQLLDLRAASAVSGGVRHACALANRVVYCWGNASVGQLGAWRDCPESDPDAPPEPCVFNATKLNTLPPIRDVAAGDDVTCALAIDGQVFCWGDDGRGSLGGGSLPKLLPPRPVLVAEDEPLIAARVLVMGATVCAIDANQLVWCWGPGFGAVPQRLAYEGVVDLALGADHSCVIDGSGLFCWGSNRNGQVGDLAAARACARLPRSACTLGPTRLALDAIRVVVGARHSCALLRTGEVACWGSNELGQVAQDNAFLESGIAVVLDQATDIGAAYARSCALRTDGRAWCWGEYRSLEEP